MLSLIPETTDGLRILSLGAHSDDIEIGAGATLKAIASRYPGSSIRWAVFSGSGERGEEARRSAEHFTAPFAAAELDVFNFRDGCFPAELVALKNQFEGFKEFQPDIIFTHYSGDRHQDHRMVSELTWQTFRNHLVFEYEIPKYDGDLGSPNVFNVLSNEDCEFKLDALDRFFGSQRNKRWFSRDTFAGLMRLRGIECQADSGFAEAFYSRKLVFK